MARRTQFFLLVAAAIVMRLLFVQEAVQGDDVYFLYGAEHALVEPLHPLNAKYAFQGEMVDMRGHTHGPVGSWILALLMMVCGGVHEVPFHLFYILFSLIAAVSAWSIASRFTDRAFEAVLLFIVVPPFVVSGNSFEADVPFLAFWLLAVALYLAEHPWLSAAAVVVATLTSYQGVLLTPILFLASRYVPNTPDPFDPRPDGGSPLPSVAARLAAGGGLTGSWAPILAAPLAVIAFQTFERLTGGAAPAGILWSYMIEHAWQSVHMKLLNAVALTGHMAVNIVCPIAWIGYKRSEKDRFPWMWIAAFFAGALAIFFAGAARYLLPLALPICILVSRSRFVWPAIAVQAALSLSLALVNYQHWNGYRDIARDVPKARRVFVNAEWGIRHYLEEAGATSLTNGQTFHAGDVVVSTAYAPKIDAPSAKVFEREITSVLPIRIMYLGGGSAFSTVGAGLWPLSFSRAPMDRVRAETIIEVQPTLAYITIKTPQAAAHVVAGVDNTDGWALDKATLTLLRQEGPAILRAKFYIPEVGVGREVQLAIDGVQVASKRYDTSEIFTLDSPVLPAAAGRTVITISTDKPLRVNGDNRPLGVLLTEIGFVRP